MTLKRARHRYLESGEAPPPGEPRRCNDGPYIRLRWRVGPQDYVETLLRNPDGSLYRTEPVKPQRRLDDRRVRQMYEEGLSTYEIGETLGFAPQAIGRSLKRSGAKIRDLAKPIDLQEVIRRYEALEGYANIARSMDVSVRRVKGVLANAGVEIRSGVKGTHRGSGSTYQKEFERMIPVIRARSGGQCEARFTIRCSGRGEHVHHRKLRSQGGRNDPVNLMDVCRSCHSSIHRNPTKGYAVGALVHSWQDPSLVASPGTVPGVTF